MPIVALNFSGTSLNRSVTAEQFHGIPTQKKKTSRGTLITMMILTEWHNYLHINHQNGWSLTLSATKELNKHVLLKEIKNVALC